MAGFRSDAIYQHDNLEVNITMLEVHVFFVTF